MNWNEVIAFDKDHVWHPYTSIEKPLPVYPVERADGVLLHLANGQKLVDGMSSWWAAIHGYNHPVLNNAAKEQVDAMSHVMFGGIVHKPAVLLAQTLIEITPQKLDKVFFSDSGSVSVEVAIKMALQFWQSKGKPSKSRLATVRSGYHGDTFKAMSVCDPVNGMHYIFNEANIQAYFADKPSCAFDSEWDNNSMKSLEGLFDEHHAEMAAFIIEPVVQGAGGMNFYHPNYLKEIRALCSKYEVLLIVDEIATGFGRTGKMFACEHAEISPDIMCVGKALTGGYLTLAATLTTAEVSLVISNGEAGVFMHGPTYMANPLACSIAVASINLLISSSWKDSISLVERMLRDGLKKLLQHDEVKDVRILGAIGVVETHDQIDIALAQKQFVKNGAWIRPFRNLIYLMPPYIIKEKELMILIEAVNQSVTKPIYHS